METETLEQLNDRISRHWVLGTRTDRDTTDYDPMGHAETWFFILRVKRVISADYSRPYGEYVVAECEYATEIYGRDGYRVVFEPYLWSADGTGRSAVLKLDVNHLYVRTYADMADLYQSRRADAMESFDAVLRALGRCDFIPDH
jgi:hypothetical protein